MTKGLPRSRGLVAALTLMSASHASAESVVQMNLREMAERAGRIFAGQVVHGARETIRAGGGEIPIVTYRIRVDDTFKGEFQVVKRARYVDLRMLDTAALATGRLRYALPRARALETGARYLLLTTRPSALGLTATVGLGQGAFRIEGEDANRRATNEVGNRMLFRGMEDARSASMRGRGREPLRYAELAERLRGLVRDQKRTR
jgi:hypothetical protein